MSSNQISAPKLIYKNQKKNILKKKVQIRAIPNSQLKSTYWSLWISEIILPSFLDADTIDKYFGQEVKETKKPTRKDSIIIEEKKQISLFDDKRSRNLSIILSRYGISSNEMFRILDNFDVDSLQPSKVD